MIILVVFIDHSVTLVMLIISQVLGHTSCAKHAQRINHISLLSVDEVTINSLRRVGSAEMSKPTKL